MGASPTLDMCRTVLLPQVKGCSLLAQEEGSESLASQVEGAVLVCYSVFQKLPKRGIKRLLFMRALSCPALSIFKVIVGSLWSRSCGNFSLQYFLTVAPFYYVKISLWVIQREADEVLHLYACISIAGTSGLRGCVVRGRRES